MTEQDNSSRATGVSVALCTCPPSEAVRLAGLVVEGGLAACVNVLPSVQSIYRWEGKLENEEESLLIIKTTTTGFPALRDALAEAHSYDVPEIILLDVADGLPAYLDWVLGGAGEAGEAADA
jgi:periplasmic divalent cation tolerance protein